MCELWVRSSEAPRVRAGLRRYSEVMSGVGSGRIEWVGLGGQGKTTSSATVARMGGEQRTRSKQIDDDDCGDGVRVWR